MPRSQTLLASVCLVALLGLLSALSIAPTAYAQCTELIRNGGFEYVGDWELGASVAPPRYISDNRHSGNWALLLGINDGVNRDSFSSARQLVAIPAGVESAALSFWYYAYADGAPTTDYMELVLLAPDGSTVIEKPWFSRNDSRAWNQMTVNLTAYRGRSFYVYFNVRNDGLGGMAYMVLDDVSLAACPGGGGSGGSVTPPIVITPPVTAVPPIITLSPGAPTPTRGACPNPILPCQVTPTPKTSAVAPTAAAPSATPLPPPATQTPVILITPDAPQVFPSPSPQVVAPDLGSVTVIVPAAGETPAAGSSPVAAVPPDGEAPTTGSDVTIIVGPNVTRISLVTTLTPLTAAGPSDSRPSPAPVAIAGPAPSPSGVGSALDTLTRSLPKYWWLIPVIAFLSIVLLFWFSGRNRG